MNRDRGWKMGTIMYEQTVDYFSRYSSVSHISTLDSRSAIRTTDDGLRLDLHLPPTAGTTACPTGQETLTLLQHKFMKPKDHLVDSLRSPSILTTTVRACGHCCDAWSEGKDLMLHHIIYQCLWAKNSIHGGRERVIIGAGSNS